MGLRCLLVLAAMALVAVPAPEALAQDANRRPTACFTQTPVAPQTGEVVTFDSACSTDPDGRVVAASWDLDGDGRYHDVDAPTATRTFDTPGTYTVRLGVADDKGALAAVTKTITVGSRPPPPDAPAQPPPPPATPSQPAAPAPQLLDPFPRVRMRGRTTPRGARFTLFSVRAPHGAVVYVRCRGRGCPAKRLQRRITTRSKRGARSVRFGRLERFLRAGVVLQVTVRRPGMVGKYTRIRIRRLKIPTRIDRCVLPGSTRPVACPGAP